MSVEPITVLIAVAVRLYREGLADALRTQPRLRVAATAGTLWEAQAAIRAAPPDVVIVDVSLEDAIEAVRALRSENATSRILAFAAPEDITTILDYAAAGADGFVTSNSSIADLVEAIERLVAGELLCSPRIAAQLLRHAAHQPPRPGGRTPGPILTSREQQVYSLLKYGRSNKEIATELRIAEATAKNHVHHVLEKLQVSSRGQAAAAGPRSEPSDPDRPRPGVTRQPHRN